MFIEDTSISKSLKRRNSLVMPEKTLVELNEVTETMRKLLLFNTLGMFVLCYIKILIN